MRDETELYQKLKKHLRGDFVRVENGVAQGVPDINVCFQGCEIWIEAKMWIPQGVLLRKHQFAWGVRRINSGGMVYVIAWHKLNHMIYVWPFKDIDVEKCGKYLKITTPPTYGLDDNDGVGLQSLLFNI
jgi:hypothetical protein